MPDRISVNPDAISVRLDLPWDVAEQIVDHGPQIIETLRKALDRRREDDDRRKKLESFQDAAAKDQMAQWAKLARHTDRRIRQECYRGHRLQRHVLREIADELGIQVGALQAIHAHFKRERQRRIMERRTARIIRLYLLGYSNAAIGRLVRPLVSGRTVGRILTDNKHLISTLQSYDRRQRKVAHAALADQPEPGKKTDNVVYLDRRQQVREERRARHRQIGVQLYRQFRCRRPSSNSKQRYQLLKELGEAHEFPVSYVEFLIRRRRLEVNAYLKRRRDKAILSLYNQGHNNRYIAQYLGLHDRTIARIVRELKRQNPPTTKRSATRSKREAGHV